MGFLLERSSYLRKAWNVLDFAVLMSTVVSLLPGLSRMSIFKVGSRARYLAAGVMQAVSCAQA